MQKSIGDVDPCRAALEDVCIVSWIVADLNSVAGAKKAIAELCQFEVQLATDPVFREPKILGHKSRVDESDPVTEHALRAMNAAQNKEHCDTLIELQRINNTELERLRTDLNATKLALENQIAHTTKIANLCARQRAWIDGVMAQERHSLAAVPYVHSPVFVAPENAPTMKTVELITRPAPFEDK